MSRGTSGGTIRAGSGRGEYMPPFWRLGPSLSRSSAPSEPVAMATARELLDDDARRRAAGGGFARDFLPDLGGDVAEGLRVRRIRLRHGDRAALVRGFADREIEPHLAKEIGAQPLRLQARTLPADSITRPTQNRHQAMSH